MEHIHLRFMHGFESTQLAAIALAIARQEPSCGAIDPQVFLLAYAGITQAAPIDLDALAIAIRSGPGSADVAQGSFHNSIYVPYIGTKIVKITP